MQPQIGIVNVKPRSIAISVIAILILAVAGSWIYLRFFWKPFSNLEPFVNTITSKVESALTTLERAVVIVNYDNSGSVWLTGRSIKDNQKFGIDELPAALAAIHTKGPAFIAHVYTTPGNLLKPMGSPPPRNPEIEKEIRNALIAAGFTLTSPTQ